MGGGEGGGEGEGTTYTVNSQHTPTNYALRDAQTNIPPPEDMCFYYFQTTLNTSDFIHTTILTSALILVIFFS